MRMKFNWLVLVLTGVLLLGSLAFTLPGTDTATVSAAGGYTYLVDGEETTFFYDPVVKKDGVLLAMDVFTYVGIEVTGALEDIATLTAGPVTAQTTIGRLTATVDGKDVALKVAPIRLRGRLFLPASLLDYFGIAFEQEGTIITITKRVADMPALTQMDGAAWTSLKKGRSFTAPVTSEAAYLEAEFTLLNEQMLADQNLVLDYGTRARLLGQLESNTLVLVELSNRSLRAGTLQTAGLYLIDEYRNQYEVTSVVDIGKGLLNVKLAPGADRMGVLVLPKLASGAHVINLYYDNNGVILGRFVDN